MLRKYLFVFVIAGVNASCCQFSMHFKRVAVFFISKQISHKDEVFNLSIFWFGISDVDQIIISLSFIYLANPKRMAISGLVAYRMRNSLVAICFIEIFSYPAFYSYVYVNIYQNQNKIVWRAYWYNVFKIIYQPKYRSTYSTVV